MNRAELKRRSKDQVRKNLFKLFLCVLIVDIVSILSRDLTVNPSIPESIISSNPKCDARIIEFIMQLNFKYNPLPQSINIFFQDLYHIKQYSTIAKFIFLISMLVLPIMTFSLSKILLQSVRNEEISIKEFFKNMFNFNMFRKALWLNIIQSLFTLFWSLLFIIPGFIKSLSYSMSFYILADNPNMTAREALKESKIIMEGHKFDLFVLCLSFTGWVLLSILTFGLAYIYIKPYFMVTITNFYEYIRLKNAKNCDRV